MNFKKRIAQLEEVNAALLTVASKRSKMINRLSVILAVETSVIVLLVFL